MNAEGFELSSSYPHLVESCPAGMLVESRSGIIYANQAAARLLGTSRAAGLLGQSMISLVQAQDRPSLSVQLNQLLNRSGLGRVTHHLTVSIATGERHLALSMAPLPLEPDPAVLVCFQDVTSEIEISQALLESEERYRLLVELSPDGIVLHNGEVVLFANAAAAAMLGGADPSDITGVNIWTFVDPGDQSQVDDRIRQLLTSEQVVPMRTDRLRRLDGKSFTANVAAATTHFGGQRVVQLVMRPVEPGS